MPTGNGGPPCSARGSGRVEPERKENGKAHGRLVTNISRGGESLSETVKGGGGKKRGKGWQKGVAKLGMKVKEGGGRGGGKG